MVVACPGSGGPPCQSCQSGVVGIMVVVVYVVGGTIYFFCRWSVFRLAMGAQWWEIRATFHQFLGTPSLTKDRIEHAKKELDSVSFFFSAVFFALRRAVSKSGVVAVEVVALQ